MDLSLAGDKKRPTRSSRGMAPTTVHALNHDVLCTVFSSLDIFDLAHCSLVCKSWSAVINKSKTFRLFYCKKWRMGGVGSSSRASESPEKPLNVYLEKTAMKRHRLALREGPVRVDHLKGHLVGGEQCRKKMGLLLTGGGDKVMRLWSLERYKCVGEFPIPDKVPLVDFDFDESKIVGLVGMCICIWKRNGLRSAFPSHEGTFSQGSCMRYCDPEAVVGCEDGTVRVFDMYSRKCSQIIRTHAGPVTCLDLTDNQLILSGSSRGNITVSGLLGGERVGNLSSSCRAGIRTLCFNPSSHLVFAGSATGYALCWDLRTMSCLWETRVSPNVLYSVQHLGNDTSTLAVGGIDGVLRILNQSTGKVKSRCVMDGCLLPWSLRELGAVQTMRGRRLAADATLDSIHTSRRPPIRSMAVGMKKVITTHYDKYIRVWNFD